MNGSRKSLEVARASSNGSPRSSGRIAALGFFLLAAAVPAAAVAAEDERIGLVLGGGGARGAAHIGVLKVLERERIPIHAIAGTSIGAIIGGLYASGYSADEIEAIVTGIDWQDIFRDAPSRDQLPMRQKEVDLALVSDFEIGFREGKLSAPSDFVQGQKLDLLLRRLTLPVAGIDEFDALPIPYCAVATDVRTVEPVVFDRGDLALAMRASMAVPGAFAPVEYGDKLLVDGGFVDNLPIEVARSMGVDRLIVVDVTTPLLPPESIRNSLQILFQAVSRLMQDRIDAQIGTLAESDVLIRPELGEMTGASFPEVAEAIAPGMRAAEEVIEQLRTMSRSAAEYRTWQAQRARPSDSRPTIEFVDVVPGRSLTAARVADRIDLETGQALDVDRLEGKLAGAYGGGTYQRISYHLVERDGATGLAVVPIDKPWGPTIFRVGLQISDDFDGQDDYQLNLEARATGLTSGGAEWRTLIEIGRIGGVTSEFYVPFGRRGDWYVSPRVGYTSLNQPVSLFDDTIAEFLVGSWLGEVEFGRDFNDRLRLSVAAIRGQDDADLRIGDPVTLPTDQVADIGGIRTTLLWDDLDSIRFPRRGSRVELSYTSFDEDLGSDSDGDLTRLSADAAFTSGANTLVFGLRSSIATRVVDAYQTQSFLGGLTFLSGLRERELLGDQQFLVRGIYYRRLGDTSESLVSLPFYLAGSLEGGNVWADYDDVSADDLIGAASVFVGVDLPIGPLQLGYGRTFDGRQSIYLTVGSLVRPRYR